MEHGHALREDESAVAWFYRVLRNALKLKKGRRASVGVIEAPCFDLCPKKSVTIALGSAPQTLIVVPKGADVAAIIAKFDLAPDTSP